MMNWLQTVAIACLVLGGVIGKTYGQTTEEARVFASTGGLHGNAAFLGISCVGQQGPVGTNSAIVLRGFSGFLRAFLLHPGLDTDGDGLADENDFDDDNDALTDLEELLGPEPGAPLLSDPLVADTDGDGADDGAEYAAGTNPNNDQSLLAILGIESSGGGDVVVWRSRDARRYELLYGNSLDALEDSPGVVGTYTASGGSHPWYETVSVATNVAGDTRGFYRIRVVP